ncbi:hypothetical protein PT974_09461 [Cladobotryum mycophilum]|uniref:ZZ-type domain-containing protein n=1 Tax=Cladobotryum mycophilum TaxID=491253 RepID=A0ABR0SG74_9HYPO
MEVWDDYFHKSKVGDLKGSICWSCLVEIRGTQWKCTECTADVSLCFKCYGHRRELHDADHTFREIGPQFDYLKSRRVQLGAREDNATSEQTKPLEQGWKDWGETAVGGEGAKDGMNVVASPDEMLEDDLDGFGTDTEDASIT